MACIHVNILYRMSTCMLEKGDIMKKKKKKQPITGSALSIDNGNQVLLGVRVSEAERQKIKMYAIKNGTTVTQLIRKYIDSL